MTTVYATAPDHAIWRIHRIGSAVLGAMLLTFGVLGFGGRLEYFSTTGEDVLGLSTNGLLSTISVVVGVLLLAAAIVGGSRSSDVNVLAGALFMAGGLVNMFLIGTQYNLLAFEMPNVVFSFVAGLVMLTLGLYGRGAGHLPEGNPYQEVRTQEHLRTAGVRRERTAEHTRQLQGTAPALTGRERRAQDGQEHGTHH